MGNLNHFYLLYRKALWLIIGVLFIWYLHSWQILTRVLFVLSNRILMLLSIWPTGTHQIQLSAVLTHSLMCCDIGHNYRQQWLVLCFEHIEHYSNSFIWSLYIVLDYWQYSLVLQESLQGFEVCGHAQCGGLPIVLLTQLQQSFRQPSCILGKTRNFASAILVSY